MKLSLKIDGVDKMFMAPFVSARMLRRSIELQKTRTLKDVTVELLDELVDYVVNVFGKQFTMDQFYDGHQAEKTMTIITECLYGIINDADEATKALQDPND